MFPGLQLVIKVLVVDGVLLQHDTVANKQVRQAIRRDGAVNVYLILMLGDSGEV